MPRLAALFFALTSTLFAGSTRDNSSFIQENGKKVAVGTKKVGSRLFFKVTRWNREGYLDTTFMTDGSVSFQFDHQNSQGYAAAADPTKMDNILVGGGTSLSDKQYFALARLSSNGTFDSTFHTDGMVTHFLNNETIRKLTAHEAEETNEFEIVAWGCEDDENCDSFAVFKSNGSLAN